MWKYEDDRIKLEYNNKAKELKITKKSLSSQKKDKDNIQDENSKSSLKQTDIRIILDKLKKEKAELRHCYLYSKIIKRLQLDDVLGTTEDIHFGLIVGFVRYLKLKLDPINYSIFC